MTQSSSTPAPVRPHPPACYPMASPCLLTMHMVARSQMLLSDLIMHTDLHSLDTTRMCMLHMHHMMVHNMTTSVASQGEVLCSLAPRQACTAPEQNFRRRVYGNVFKPLNELNKNEASLYINIIYINVPHPHALHPCKGRQICWRDVCDCAVAELFEMVCSEPEWVSLEEVVEVFVQRDAVAFAQVRPLVS